MKLPKQLKGFNLFIEGMNQYGVTVNIKRPSVKFATEGYTPGGGAGELTVIHGIEKLTLEITSKGYDADIMREMGGAIAGKLLRYKGALQQEDSNEYLELKGEARGRIVESDPGSDEQGKGGEHKFTVELTYWKEELDGKQVTELDLLGNKISFGGNDNRAGMRAILGI